MIDYSRWLTKRDAADTLGVSTKTLEQYARRGQVQQARWKRPAGGPAIVVYNPEDIARLVHARHPNTPFVVPANGNGLARPVTETLARVEDDIAAPALLFAQALRDVATYTTSRAEKKWVLTVKEAAEASGWTVAYLRRAIKDGTLPATKDRGWRIKRADLEKL